MARKKKYAVSTDDILSKYSVNQTTGREDLKSSHSVRPDYSTTRTTAGNKKISYTTATDDILDKYGVSQVSGKADNFDKWQKDSNDILNLWKQSSDSASFSKSYDSKIYELISSGSLYRDKFKGDDKKVQKIDSIVSALSGVTRSSSFDAPTKDDDIAPVQKKSFWDYMLEANTSGQFDNPYAAAGAALGAKLTDPNTYEGWLKKGNEDAGKATFGTVADVTQDLTTGAVGLGERIVDFFADIAPDAIRSQAYTDNPFGQAFMPQAQKEANEKVYQQARTEADAFIKKDLYDEEKVAKQLLSNLYAGSNNINKVQSGQFLTKEDILAQQKGAQDILNYMDKEMEDDSVLDEKSDSLVQSAGQLAGTAALSAAGVPWWLTTGASTYGSEVENALNQGATSGEARLSGIISAGAEILTEKISGGIKFGGKTLDEGLTKLLARNISSKSIRTMAKLGIDMAGEGFEEVLSGWASAIGQKLTYEKEKDLKELFTSEDAWESFIGGAVLGGGGSVTQAVQGKITGVDPVTELTKNEQKVVDKLYEDALAEAEKKGKVTQKQKAEIYDDILHKLDKGYISIETIEEVLGDRSAYDSLEKESKEFDTLFNTATGQLSKAQQNRLAELEAKNEENPYKDALKTTKEQYSKSVFDMVKGDRLSESYREKDRVYQDFEADFDKYKGTKHEDAARKTLESAMKAGANNTNRVHDIVDMAAHISADTGRTFEFKSGEQITEDFIARQTKEIAKLEKIPEAKRTAEQSEMLTELKDLLAKVESGDVVVDGDITSNGIVLNLDSSKPLNRTVGHEITHSFEPEKGKTSKEYTELRDSLFAYAKSKGIDIAKELKTRELMYKGVTDANPEAELVADLVGDFLFTDSDYVSKLSAENRNVFQKMWDKIKYLCKVATAGSQEARELERVRKAFADAYRAGGKAQVGTQHSLSPVEAVQPKSDKWSRTLTTDEVKEQFPDLWDVAADESEVRNPTQISGTVKSYRKIYDNLKAEGFDGTILDASSGLGYGTKAGVEEYGFNVEDIEPYPDKSYNPKYTDYSTLDKKYDAIISNAVLNVLPQDQRDALVVKMGEMLNDGGRIFVNVRGSDVKNASSKVAINEDLMEYYIAQSGSYQKGFKTAELVAYLQDTLGDGFTVEPTKMFGAVSAVVTKNGTAKYSLSDSDGRQLTKEQQEYFKDSKMRDENGNLKVMYHGSQDAGFHVFDSKFSDDDTSFFFVDRNEVAQSYSGTTEVYEARTIRTVEDMNNFLAEMGEEDYKVVEENGKFTLYQENEKVADSDTAQGIYEEYCDWVGVGYGDANYKVYLNLTNPLVVDAEGRNWDNVTREFSQEIADRYHSLTAEEKATLTNLASFGDVREFRREINKAMDLVESRGGGDGYTTRLASAYKKLNLDDGKVNIYDLFSIAEDDFSDLAIEAWAVQQMTTRDYAQKAKAEGYDGVIFKNIHDNGGYSNGSEGASTVAIAFDSNQIKSTANAQPTADPDIRYSLSDSDGKRLTKEQQEFFKDSKVRDKKGNLLVVYHGTTANFNAFKKGDVGFHFGTKGAARGRAGYGKNVTIKEVYLNITNPVVFDEDLGSWDADYRLTRELYDRGILTHDEAMSVLRTDDGRYKRSTESANKKLASVLMAKGYDGIAYQNTFETKKATTSYIAFASNQIKSTANANPTADPDIRYSMSSMANTFFGDENMTAEQFKKADYRQTQGYKDYVDQCLNNYRQTRADFDEATARKSIEDSIEGIIKVAIAAKQAGYDIYDDATKRNTKDSKNRLLFSSLEPNSDYFTSHDVSTICDKHKNFSDIYAEIVKAEEAKGVPVGKRFFDNVDNYFAIHKIMADKGLTTPCRECYVNSMRKNLAPMANAFLRLVQETNPDNTANDQLWQKAKKSADEYITDAYGKRWTQKVNNASTRELVLTALAEYDMSVSDLSVETLTTPDGLAQLKIQAPMVYEAFNSFYGQSKPKMERDATPFRFGELTALLTNEKGEIVKSRVDRINSTGGFRLQSYSDFQIQNYTDVLQVLFEAGTLGLKGHAYTKVPAFLDATEGTNLKRNISIFMYKDGDEWKLDKNDSFPYDLEEIYELVKADKSGNTGIIAVSQNADMSAWIMANDYVGYGIPFHKSGLKMGTVRDTEVKTEDGRVIKGYSGTIDHTKQQTEVWAKASDDHKALTKVKKGINIYSFWDFDNKANLSKNELIEKNVKRYIDQCEMAGYLPKFRNYVMNNGKVLQDVLKYSKELGFVGEDATIEDISFQYKGYTIPYGYYKFLGDFGMFAPDGKASAQKTLSLENYDFDKAVRFFSDAETLRRNEILQQFANGEERQRYRDSDLTAGELQDIVKRKRSEVAKSVVGDLAPAMSMTEQGKQFAPIGNFDVYGKDFRVQNPMQDDVAPAQEAVEDSPVTEVTEETVTEETDLFPDDISPVQDLEQLMAEEAEMRSVMEAYASVGDIEAVNKLIPEYEAIRERIRDLEADENQRADSLTDEDAPPEMEAPYYSERGETDLTKKATADIVRDVRASLGLTNPQMADAKDIIERYRSGELQTKEQLVDALQDKFGTATESVEDYVLQEVKRELRTRRLNVTKDIQRGIADYADLMRRNRGRIRFSKEGLAVDELYQELSDAYPHYFPAEIFNPEDQLLQMIDVANMPHIQQTQRTRDIANIEETADIIINGISDFQYRQDMALSERDARGAFDNLVKNARKYAPPMTAPIQTAPLKQATADTDPAPIFESKDKDAVKGQQTMFEPPKPNPKVANVLTEETAIQKEKSGIGLKLASALVDKGMVFENLSLEKGNHEIQAKWNYALPTNTEARAQYFMEHGADGVKPLKDIKKTVEKSGKTYEFFDYLYHVHNIDRMTLEDRFNDTPNKTVFGETITADVSRAKAAEYEKANPEFKAWAKDIYAFNKHLRSLLVKNGLISQETADLWEKMYPHYVPIRRVDSEGQNISVPLDSRKTGVNNPVKRATGGSSDIMPLFETMALRTEQTFRAIARNSFGVELKNTLGTTIEAQKNAAGVDEMIDTIEAQEDHLLKPGGWNSNPTFTVFENGEKVEFEITEDMYNALKPADGVLAHRSKAIGKVGDLRRNLLTVWNPVFALYRNPIKDIQDVAVNSQHAVKTYLNVPNAIIQMATGGKYATEYHQSGGKSNTYFDSRTNKFKKEDNWFKKTIGLPVRAIETAGEFIEEIPRLAEYIASRKSGRSVERSMLDAARVTTNFAAGGDFTKFLNSHGFTFLNASVQGASQHIRNFREAKQEGLKGYVKVLAKYVAAGLPGILLNSLLWDDDEEYEELSDYVKENYYVVAKTEDGKFVRIPKGRTSAVMQNAMEQMQNLVTGDDDVDFSTFFELFMNNIAPSNPIENNILAPILQVANNEAWYGGDLVPSRLQDLPDEEQFDESTDSISKWLGEKTGYSPYKINYLLDQYSGGLGDVFLPMLTPEAESGDNSAMGNFLAPWKKEMTTDKVLNNQNPGDFYDLKDELEVMSNSKNATEEDEMRSMYMDSVSWAMGDLYAQKREIQSSDLSDSEKYEAVRGIQEQINELAKTAMAGYNDVTIDGLYSEVGDRRYNKDAETGKWYEIREKNSDGSDNYYYQKEQKVTKALGISYGEYWNNREEYDYAYDKPEQYTLAQAVGGYQSYRSYISELWDIKADKDENGKSISGSRKEKVIDYLNEMDIDYYTKIILFKNEYNADDTYNVEIIEYLNGRDDISYKEMETILKYLGFEVDSNGNISW